MFVAAGGPHTTAAASTAELHSLCLRPDRFPALWAEPAVLAAVPMYAALAGHLSHPDLPDDARRRAEAVLFDVLVPAPVASVELAWPRDDRARRVAGRLADDPADDRDAAAWAREVGVTSSRCFAWT